MSWNTVTKQNPIIVFIFLFKMNLQNYLDLIENILFNSSEVFKTIVRFY